MLPARKLLQCVGLGVSYPLSQDTDEGEVTIFICFESLGHLSFLPQLLFSMLQSFCSNKQKAIVNIALEIECASATIT